jgi:hypothetical protein
MVYVIFKHSISRAALLIQRELAISNSGGSGASGASGVSGDEFLIFLSLLFFIASGVAPNAT